LHGVQFSNFEKITFIEILILLLLFIYTTINIYSLLFFYIYPAIPPIITR
jgi:hypothetical protein